jgi:hypothetical protein
MKITIRVLVGLLFIQLIFFLSTMRYSTAWNPAKAPEMTGPYSLNQLLAGVERVALDNFIPIDISIDIEQQIYFLSGNGQILKTDFDGHHQQLVKTSLSRPVAMGPGDSGEFFVLDARAGLVLCRLEPGSCENVLDQFWGERFRGLSALAQVGKEKIYFTEAPSNDKHGLNGQGIYEDLGEGKLFVFDLQSASLTLVLDGLFGPKGLAVSEDGSFLLLSETYRYRVLKVWLDEDRIGKTEIILENLPSLPGDISRGDQGIFWLALPYRRHELIDVLVPYSSPWRFLGMLPDWLRPKVQASAMILGMTGNGELIFNLQDPSRYAFAPTKKVKTFADFLYVLNGKDPYFGRIGLEEFRGLHFQK